MAILDPDHAVPVVLCDAQGFRQIPRPLPLPGFRKPTCAGLSADCVAPGELALTLLMSPHHLRVQGLGLRV